MPPRKSNVSVASNAADDSIVEPTSAKASKEKDGLSVDDLSLPKSMVARLAKGVLPANTQIQKDALLALHKSATVFVSYLASNSSENAQTAGKKTIQPLDVMAALKEAEFDDFLPRLEAELKKYNDTQCDKRNNYRRKIKEEKAAAVGEHEGDEVVERSGMQTEGESLVDDSIAAANGHVNGLSTNDEGERPVKKFKAANGTAIMPDADETEEDDGEEEEDVEESGTDDQQDEDDEDEEEEEEVFEDADEDIQHDEDETQPDSILNPNSQDETLDDSDSD